METKNVAKVGVIGLTGQTAFFQLHALPRPGETVISRRLSYEPGGKGHNQAVACARAGALVVFLAAVGQDAYAEECKRHLEKESIDVLLQQKAVPTAFAAVSTQENGENFVQVFPGASQQLLPEEILSEESKMHMQGCRYLLLQNELSAACLEAAFRLASQIGAGVIFNPAPAGEFSPELLRQCFVITPNEEEAKCIAGFSPDQDVTDEELWKGLSHAGAPRAVVTLGKSGVLLADENGCRRVSAFCAGSAVDTVGAGDVFNGSLAAELALGADLAAAVQYAVIASGISVTRFGTADSCPFRKQVLELAKNM